MRRFALGLYLRLFARARFYKLNYGFFRLGLAGLGIRNWENETISGEKFLIEKILPKMLPEDPMIFDVGADTGILSSLLLGHFAEASIHAFEPHPGNFLRLKERLSGANVKLHNFALGEKAGMLTLFDKADRAGGYYGAKHGSYHASLYREVISEIHKENVVSYDVQVETLDNIAAQEDIRFIDFLKIDTEGSELAVLKGAARLLEEGRIGCIQFEFNEMNVISRSFFRDFRKTLTGYDLYRLLPNGLLLLGDRPLLTELFAYQNILAVPKAAKFHNS